MASSEQPGQRHIRINVKFEEHDNPRLAAELQRFKKGSKRHNRLLTLATLGLAVEQGIGLPLKPAPDVPSSNPVGKDAPRESENYEYKMSSDDVKSLLGEAS